MPSIRTASRPALAAAALLLLAGCSAAPADDTVPAEEMRTVTDYFGTVEVPAEPLRIVAADPVSLSLMLSLDVQPVAASFNPLALPAHLGERGDDIENVAGEEGGFDPDLEGILAQEPDLVIVAAGYDGEGDDAWNKETYDRIAATGVPTFGYAYNDGVSLEDVTGGLDAVAEALGRTDEADRLMSDLTERMDALRGRVAAAGLEDEPVSAVRLSADGQYSIRVGTGESIAFRALGMAQPEGQRDPSAFRIDLSPENLGLLSSADALFVYTDEGAEAEREAVASSPLWSGLPAVRDDRVHWVEASVWNASDPIGLGMILDDIESLFIEPAER
jgi:ABC-type Fe3+-hydroxamate transport system substrate-binding protein